MLNLLGGSCERFMLPLCSVPVAGLFSQSSHLLPPPFLLPNLFPLPLSLADTRVFSLPIAIFSPRGSVMNLSSFLSVPCPPRQSVPGAVREVFYFSVFPSHALERHR